MNTKYRINSFSRSQLDTMFIFPDHTSAMMSLCALVDFKEMDRQKYENWISTWKYVYKDLSEAISIAKKDHNPITQRQIAHGKRVANTLLNVRQYAKDARRGRKDIA